MSDSSARFQADSLSLETSSSQLRQWQLKLLSGASLLGLVTSIVVVGLSFFSPGNPNHNVLLIGSVILGFGSAVLLLLKNLSFWVRSIFSLVFFFIFTNTLFFFYGWGVAALLALVGFVAISTTLLFRKSIRYGLVTSFLTLVLWAALSISQSLSSQGSSISISRLFNDGFIVCAIGFFIYFSLFQLKELYLSKIDENQERVKEILEVNNKYQNALQSLSHQEDQLRKLMELTRRLPLGFSKQETIARFIDEFGTMFELSNVALYLVDPSHEKIEIVYGNGISGKRLLSNKHQYTANGTSLISQAIRKNTVVSDELNKVYDLSNLLANEDDNSLVHAVPITEGNKPIGALVIVMEPSTTMDETRLLIFMSAAQLMSLLIRDNQTDHAGNSSSAKSTVSSSLEALLVTEKLSQYSYPEGEIISTGSSSSMNEIDLGSTGHLRAMLRIPDRELSQSELEFVEELAVQTEKALNLASGLTSLQKSIVSEEKSKEIAARFSGKKKMEDILRAAVIELGKLPEIINAKIALISPDEVEVTPRPNGRKNDNVE